MNRTKLFIVKINDENYALKCSQVIDVLEGFNSTIIDKFSTEDNTHLFYRNLPLQMINTSRILNGKTEGPGKITSILVIKDTQDDSNYIFGLPIQEVIGYYYFNLLSFVSLIRFNEFCSCSFTFENKIIHFLDMKRIFDWQIGRYSIMSRVNAFYS
jgi:hypothetical protein